PSSTCIAIPTTPCSTAPCRFTARPKPRVSTRSSAAKPRTDLDSLCQSRQSPSAPDPRPQRVEERGRRKSARIRSDAESTQADRAGESGVVQGTEAPAAVRSFFCAPCLSFLKDERQGRRRMPDLLVRSL